MGNRYNNERHRRRSIRLQGYDYSRVGAYFLTICTHNRGILFGEIIDGEMMLNDLGRIVESEWAESERMRSEIQLDEWVVMPNHFHGIVWITDNGEINDWRGDVYDERIDGRGERPLAPTEQLVVPSGTGSKSIGALVAGFKSAVTKRINKLRAAPGSPVWQRNYYEHIIRSEAALNRTRQYILENPVRWDEDMYNPNNPNNSNSP